MSTQTPALTPERILQRLDWQVIRRLDGLLQGDYRSLFYGYGIDFADLREYQPEDDIRYIDWNVTARMDTPYVRQYIEDREITAWFLLDLSPSMDFGTAQNEKRAVLIDFVTTVARILTRHGNRVGAMFYTGEPGKPASARNGKKNGNQTGGDGDYQPTARTHIDRTIPARGGRNQVLLLASSLLKQPHLPHAPFTNLAPLLEGGLNAIKKRSLVFIISDFISAPGWERPLGLLSQRHEVLAVRLWDPREINLPDIGPVVIEDAETGEQLTVDTSDRKFRARFEEAARRRETMLAEAFKHAGVDMLSLSTEEDMVHALVRFASMRKQRRR
jgi:uncharacterized protein (DUF58 family)